MSDATHGSAPTAPRGDADLLAEAARRAAAREPFALCTVVATRQSAPRDAGAKMLVAPDGSISGTKPCSCCAATVDPACVTLR
jgi:xanthine/CO dehydrogenase XdhC/CoxF family maturation factor